MGSRYINDNNDCILLGN